MAYKKDDIIKLLDSKCLNIFGCTIDDATEKQAYKSLCYVVKDLLAEKRSTFAKKFKEDEGKQVYYMSMEFLVGTSLRNNLYNLGLESIFKNALKQKKIDITHLYDMEPDAGLGNGGLGRLASCYMDSMTSVGMMGTGFSIRYEFGIFRQKIVDGWQMEFPDNWLEMGDVWLNRREDEAFEVKFGGHIEENWCDGKLNVVHKDYQTVMAIPYEMFISGHDTNAVKKLI